MEREEVFAYTAGCYTGEPASCTHACPFRLDLRSFLKKAARGRWDAAYKELCAAVLFPEITAALCPRPCETACQRQTVLGGDPIAVGHMERACLSYSKKKEAAPYAIPPKAERIAVVGAGPAGLSAALLLARRGFPVTVFDRNEGWGGALRADPRFPSFDADFARAFSAERAEFRLGTALSSLSELDAYHAVLLATGRGGVSFGLLDGWDETLCATENPRVFLAGELTGVSLTDGMAQAARAVRSVEAFVQTGSPAFAAERRDADACARYAPHPDEADVPGVRPAGETYTEDEARAEAARCMQCDCTACMDACELLIRYKKKPPRINHDVFMDGQSRNSVSSACITRQTWSCNLCGRCGAKCGEGVDLRGLFRLSRAGRVAGGNYPPALHDYWLREMAFAAGEGSFSSAEAGKTYAYAFFPGCRLGASKPSYVTSAAAFLRETRDAGLLLDCCGAPAFWAGDDNGFHRQLSRLRAGWEALGKPRLITACPTCDRMLAQFLPEIPLVSLYAVLAEAGAAKRAANAAPRFARAAVFDPCAAAGMPAVKRAVRALAAAGGTALADYDNDGKCCGFGGHMQLASPALYEEITKNRAAEAEEPYLVYCANCREVFASRGKACAHILDVVFDLEDRAVPTLAEKRENSLSLKKELMKTYRNEAYEPARSPWDDLCVAVPAQVREKMERSLVSLGDVRETIWRAEQAEEGFLNEDGELLCSMEGRALTYWVRYRREPSADGGACFAVTDVYCHRMRPRGEEGAAHGG